MYAGYFIKRFFRGLRVTVRSTVLFLNIWLQSERHSLELSTRAAYVMGEKSPLEGLCKYQMTPENKKGANIEVPPGTPHLQFGSGQEKS